jgi:hypothetical protein
VPSEQRCERRGRVPSTPLRAGPSAELAARWRRGALAEPRTSPPRSTRKERGSSAAVVGVASYGVLVSNKRTRPKLSRSIPADQQRLLWVRAGGRCEWCNKYLLEDASTLAPLNFGEMAHNVGHKQSARSPRGMDPLVVERRNDADNLLLLCGEHHPMVDSKLTAGIFTVDFLRHVKREHEDRIRHLTGLAKDSETVVLRVIGDIRGGAVELSEQSAARAVLAGGRRFPRFGWGYGGADFEVDLRGLPSEGSDLFWEAGRTRIEERIGERLREAVSRQQVRHLSVFALGRIPLLACVGEQLDDKVPTDLFQKQRGGDEGWGWDDEAEPVTFIAERIHDGGSDRVALIIGLSAALSLEDLPQDSAGGTVWAISPHSRQPSRDVLRARESLDNFARTYHDCLGEIEAVRPKPSTIDVFPAVPATAAVTLGRGLMRGAQPALHIYERMAPNEPFAFALEINS